MWQKYLEGKVGPEERLAWTHSHIENGFQGEVLQSSFSFEKAIYYLATSMLFFMTSVLTFLVFFHSFIPVISVKFHRFCNAVVVISSFYLHDIMLIILSIFCPLL